MTPTNDAPARAPSGSGVRVKQLEWAEIEYDRGDGQTDTCGEWEAPSIVGVYAINISTCGDMHAPWEVFGGDAGKIGNFPTFDEAKAAAQADYEARILSVLASDASPRGEAITARYTNWRGETAERTFIPHRVFFGSNEWHPEPQVLIEATDCEKGALRTFAAAGFVHPARATVESDRLRAALQRIADHPEKFDDGTKSYAVGFAFWNVQKIARAALAPVTEGRKGNQELASARLRPEPSNVEAVCFESDKTRSATLPARMMLSEGISIQALGATTNAIVEGALQGCISHIDELEADFKALQVAVALSAGSGLDGDIGYEETYLLNLLRDDRLTEEDLHRAMNRIRFRHVNRAAPTAPVITTGMVNAAWNEAKNRRMTGLPTDFRAVLEAAFSAREDSKAGLADAHSRSPSRPAMPKEAIQDET